MLVDLLNQIILELLRALFLEALCQRVKNRIAIRAHRHRRCRYEALLLGLHLRHRERLLHKLTTEADQKL